MSTTCLFEVLLITDFSYIEDFGRDNSRQIQERTLLISGTLLVFRFESN